jgi:hypothetical protein
VGNDHCSSVYCSVLETGDRQTISFLFFFFEKKCICVAFFSSVVPLSDVNSHKNQSFVFYCSTIKRRNLNDVLSWTHGIVANMQAAFDPDSTDNTISMSLQ